MWKEEVRYKLVVKLQYCNDRKCPAKVGRRCWYKGKCENQGEVVE